MNQPALQQQYQVSLIPTEEVGLLWDRVFDLLAPAVTRSNGRWTMPHLAHALSLGQHWLWVCFDTTSGEIKGACTTQIVQYPAAKRMAFQFLGGTDFDDWFQVLIHTIESCAADSGCDGTEATARLGFKPYLTGEGYEMKYAVYDKPFGGFDDE